MKSPQTSALTVRFIPEMREQLEVIASLEHRPVANQVVHFVASSIEGYMFTNGFVFDRQEDGKLTVHQNGPSPHIM